MDVDISDIDKLMNVVTERSRDGFPVLRVKARVSQEITAKKTGVSRQTHNAIEIGNRDIPWTTFLKQDKFSRK